MTKAVRAGVRTVGALWLAGGLADADSAFAEAPVVAAGTAPRIEDPCPAAIRPGEWIKLPDGGPAAPPRPVPASARFDGRRVVVGYGTPVAFDVCASRWLGAAAPAGRAVDGGIDVGGGARLVPSHDPRRSSYDGFANARVVLPSGREIRMPALGAPSARTDHVMAFDGRRLLVWGGFGPSDAGAHGAFGDGAVFDSRARRWRPMSPRGAPAPRFLPIAAWTGRKLLVWGGGTGVPGREPTKFDDGAAYDPARDRWSPMSSEGAPVPRWKPVVVWTGKVMVVAGGGDSRTIGGARGRDDAWTYDPDADRWSAVEGAPKLAESHWILTFVDPAGRVLFIDTHVLRSFGVLDPRTRRFEEVTMPETLRERSGVGAVWTGRRLLVWGGYRQQPGYVNPCDNFRGPGGCDPPSPAFAVFSDGWVYAPPR